MKAFANIVLFLFISFLAAPTVVSLIEDKVDVSMVYSLTEEELQKELKEVKVSPQFELQVAFFDPAGKSSGIKSAELRKHDNVSGEICSPPPEII